ncbi:MAG: PQQ-dependent sugar dehydrogenase [Anaerolineae bacterium]|nr:PQQ-dependent sugar dehydrogenase [Anaerolineae bacterium]
MKRMIQLVFTILGGILLGLLAAPLATRIVASVDYDYAPPANLTLQVGFKAGIRQVYSGFSLPIFLTHAGDGSQRIFVVEKVGRVQIIQDGKLLNDPFLDITDIVGASGYEQGLLGLAFHPEYRNNGLFYLNYTNRSGDTVVAEYRVSSDNPNKADPTTAREVLSFDQPFPNHNGGMIAFGPDKYLYIGIGDGGSAGDPLRAGQDSKTWLGKILRIDVNGSPYLIPGDNPFVTGDAGLAEIWSLGWRNPWRFSFDRLTGDLYVGDVGQNSYEEVSVEKQGSPGGLNYGWNVMEGSHCFQPRRDCNQTGLVLPVTEYNHEMGISITGGYVYRGSQYPALQGYYFFGDFGSGRIWALKETSAGQWEMAQLFSTGFPLSSFGEDEAGEVYLLDFANGSIYQLISEP